MQRGNRFPQFRIFAGATVKGTQGEQTSNMLIYSSHNHNPLSTWIAKHLDKALYCYYQGSEKGSQSDCSAPPLPPTASPAVGCSLCYTDPTHTAEVMRDWKDRRTNRIGSICAAASTRKSWKSWNLLVAVNNEQWYSIQHFLFCFFFVVKVQKYSFNPFSELEYMWLFP